MFCEPVAIGGHRCGHTLDEGCGRPPAQAGLSADVQKLAAHADRPAEVVAKRAAIAHYRRHDPVVVVHRGVLAYADVEGFRQVPQTIMETPDEVGQVAGEHELPARRPVSPDL